MKQQITPSPVPPNMELQWDPDWERSALANADPQTIWAREQLKKVVVTPWPAPGCGWFQATCPVCGQNFFRACRRPQTVIRAIRDHLIKSAPPSGEQYAHLQIGDRIRFGNVLYELFEDPHRPLAYLGVSGYEKLHTFYLVLRSLADGRFFRTRINDPSKIRSARRPSGCTIKQRRRIPYFQLLDFDWQFVFDTDYPSLAARAINRLVDVRTMRVNLDSTGLLGRQFNSELAVIKERQKQELATARSTGKRYEKAFSIGMRYPWPPKTDQFGGYESTFNIIDRFGNAIFSSDSPDAAARFWKSKDALADSKIGLVISGNFENQEEIDHLLDDFKTKTFYA